MEQKENFQEEKVEEKESLELEELKKEIENYKDQLLRAHADFDNYRKRMEKNQLETIKFASKNIIIKLLPVIDNFERALTMIKDKITQEGFILVLQQFQSILQEEGLKEIESLGKLFDPYKHLAIDKVPDEKKENEIIEVLEKGFMLNDTVLRPAKVKVSGGKNE